MAGWQPISTAPKVEGQSVLLGWKMADGWPSGNTLPVCIGFWSGELKAWCDDATENDFTPQPTDWMPLPEPPQP